MVARSRLSRAPTMSSNAGTCEIAHASARRSMYWIAAGFPRETSMRTLLSIKNGMWSSCARLESAVEFAAKTIYIFDTVSRVVAIPPHASEGRIANGSSPAYGHCFRHVYFNDRALFDRYVLKGPEDAILILRRDGRTLLFSMLRGLRAPAPKTCRSKQ